MNDIVGFVLYYMIIVFTCMNDKNGFYLYYIMLIGCDVNICNKIYIGGIQMKSLNGTINVNQNSDNCRKKKHC